MERKQVIFLAIVATVAGFFIWNEFFRDDRDDGPGPPTTDETSVFVEPSNPTLRDAVQPIREKVRGKKNLLGLAWFYYRVAQAERTRPTTTSQARMIHKIAGEELSRVAGTIAYMPELEPAIESIFDRYIGRENKKLTQSDRDKISDLFMAVAWAIFTEADKKTAIMKLRDGTQIVFGRHDVKIDAPPDASGKKMPDFFVNGLVEDEADPEPLELKQKKMFSSPIAFQDDDEEIVDGEEYPTGLMFDPAELVAWNQQGLMMSQVPLKDGAGKTRLLYKALQRFDSTAYEGERQTTGDCTSHAFRNACDTSRAYEIVKGEPEDFVARGATEAIYGYRARPSQGMSPFRAAKFVSEVGGVMVRRNYGDIDVTTYNAETGINWGKRGGPPKSLLKVLNKNQMQRAALVKNTNEARDAIFSGYALAVGSNFGFDSSRDEYGFAQKKGSWMHAMAWVAVSTAYELAGDDWRKYGSEKTSPCFLVVNSWGKWNGGPEGKFDIPIGAFWITEKNATKMIAQNMSFACGSFDGFPLQPVSDWGFSYLSKRGQPGLHGGADLNGATEASVGVVLELFKRDPTVPISGEGGDNDDGDAVTPDECSNCNGKGYIEQGDGHRSPCPGDSGNGWLCPFKR